MEKSDNFHVAVMQKVNELAGRWGIKPYNFVATFEQSDKEMASVLAFDNSFMNSATAEELKKYSNMLTDLGIYQHAEKRLVGSDETIYEALEKALKFAPKQRLLN